MNNDVLAKLRKAVCYCNDFDGPCPSCLAVEEIERLQKELLLAQLERDEARKSLRETRRDLIDAYGRLHKKWSSEKGTQK